MSIDPRGEFFQAREGGAHALLDRKAFDLVQAQAGDAGGEMEVKGVGYVFGTVGWFGLYGAISIQAGAFIEAPGKHRKYRDMMGLAGHDANQVLARQGNNTLSVAFGEKQITYSMRLNKNDGMARDIWARLMREDINASSIGFVIVEGDYEEMYDNSLDADPETRGEKIEVFSVTKAELIEVSLVSQGAYASATSYPARRTKETVGEVANDIVTGGETIDHEVKNSLPVQSAMLTVDDITEADLDPEEPDASADLAGGGEGDDGGDGGSVDGGAAPDGDDGDPAEGQGQEAVAEAERQGMTLKDIVGRAPAELKARLADVN